MLWKSNLKGENLCTGQKIEPDIESKIENMSNKYLKIRLIRGFEERFLSFNHIVEIKFDGIDDTKIKIIEYNFGWSLESYGGRANIQLTISLITGEIVSVNLSDYYVEIHDINSVNNDIKNFMSLKRFKDHDDELL